ncbi:MULTISPECIES: AzlD domain-containing protein [Pasteurellaceae]|uniref:AzlD domain-containing protein n=3 Tax=Pasteurellaceae TaxID=712 RepID=A0AAQ4LUN7_9PAST|nr:AzlD domain-containing protein [Pasteurella atlantica]MBR0572654.1 AzlD domain-containing protein [Pasteurella atlantica]MDP8038600.1 AzlD domain-containing protein [Pasteurella atlantica]MDP8040692.1 AzlD domain-containing protein [Pasteurella atlantica]MDP8042827.1 AzlD domain-containing protein [Pasteurella atlantica]MDP8044914.1 AzlD domain-containing protein [Pasteurella atlantica]
MISSSYFTIAILVMAVITFLIRYLFFTRSFKINLSNKVRSILLFTAPCVLTAMFTPVLFQDFIATKQVTALIDSSYFWAGICAILFSIFIKHTFTVIILSMVAFYGLRTFL